MFQKTKQMLLSEMKTLICLKMGGFKIKCCLITIFSALWKWQEEGGRIVEVIKTNVAFNWALTQIIFTVHLK